MTELSIALPDTVLMEDRDLRDKTLKLGQLARSASIFRVKKVIIFPDPKGGGGSDRLLIKKILQYLETPQYLRKRLYPLTPDLKYAGLLPPLKIPSHKREAVLKDGEFREAFVEEDKRGERLAFVGTPSLVRYTGRARPGSRQTVKIIFEGGIPKAKDASRNEVGEYWGYSVILANSISESLGEFDLRVATSRLGDPIVDAWVGLSSKLASSGKCLVAFGSPKRGLFDMFRKEDLNNSFEFVINTIPEQGVETVRTEEAVFCSLEALRLAELVQGGRRTKL